MICDRCQSEMSIVIRECQADYSKGERIRTYHYKCDCGELAVESYSEIIPHLIGNYSDTHDLIKAKRERSDLVFMNKELKRIIDRTEDKKNKKDYTRLYKANEARIKECEKILYNKK